MCGILSMGLGVLALAAGVLVLALTGLFVWMIFGEDKKDG